ncbi:MAG: acc operon protein [Halanaeroarchaeum sp.]
METSRFEIDVPDAADPDEAAAIAVAIGAHLTDRQRATSEPPAETWQNRQWSFAGKRENTGGCPVRVPDGAPTNAWTAAGRLEKR